MAPREVIARTTSRDGGAGKDASALVLAFLLVAAFGSAANAFTMTLQGTYSDFMCSNASAVQEVALLNIIPRFGPVFLELDTGECYRPSDIFFYSGLESPIVSATVNYRRRGDGSLSYLFDFNDGWMKASCSKSIEYGMIISGQLRPQFYAQAAAGCNDESRAISLPSRAIINQCLPLGCINGMGCLYARMSCNNVTSAVAAKLEPGGMNRVKETPPPTPTPSPTPKPFVEEVWPQFTSTTEGFFTDAQCSLASRLSDKALLAKFPRFGPAFVEIERDICTPVSELFATAGVKGFFDSALSGRRAGELATLARFNTGSFKAVCKKLPGRLIRGVFDITLYESAGCSGTTVPLNVDGQCIPLGCVQTGAVTNGTAVSQCLYLRAGCANITLTEDPPILPASGVNLSPSPQPALALTFSDTTWAAKLTTCPESRVPWCPSDASWTCTPGATSADIVTARCMGSAGEVFPQRTVKSATMTIKLGTEFTPFLDAYGGQRNIFAPTQQESKAADVVYAALNALWSGLSDGGTVPNPDKDPAAPWVVASLDPGSVLVTLQMRVTFTTVASGLLRKMLTASRTFLGVPIKEMRDEGGNAIAPDAAAAGTVTKSRLSAASQASLVDEQRAADAAAAAAAAALAAAPAAAETLPEPKPFPVAAVVAANVVVGSVFLALGLFFAVRAWRRRSRAEPPLTDLAERRGSERRVAPPAPV